MNKTPLSDVQGLGRRHEAAAILFEVAWIGHNSLCSHSVNFKDSSLLGTPSKLSDPTASCALSASPLSPFQSTTFHDSNVKSTGSKQFRQYTSSNAEYPVDHRTEIRSAHSASGRYFSQSVSFLLQYLASELTMESCLFSARPFGWGW
jgi:hypothetical protein